MLLLKFFALPFNLHFLPQLLTDLLRQLLDQVFVVLDRPSVLLDPLFDHVQLVVDLLVLGLHVEVLSLNGLNLKGELLQDGALLLHLLNDLLLLLLYPLCVLALSLYLLIDGLRLGHQLLQV